MFESQLVPKNKIRQRIARFAMALESCFLVASLVLPALPAHAETYTYRAQVSSGAVTMAVGENKLITLKFKNVGTKSWTGGKSSTAVYLYGKSSIFGHAAWLGNDMPAVIKEKTVAPGAMASASFYVHAPSTPGTYTERFLLSSAPNAWIKDSTVTVTFTVVKATASAPAPTPVATTPTVTTPVSPTASDVVPSSSVWKAQLVDKGGIEWQMGPSDHIVVDLKFKNVGTQTWLREGDGFLSLYTWGPKYRVSPFKDFSWTDTRAAKLVEASVKPGQTGTVRLEFRAPDVPGVYQETFQLAAEDKAWLDGGSVTFPIKVSTPDSYIAKGITPGSTTPSGTYSTVLLLASQKSATLSGNGRLQLTNGFKNNGTAVWNSRTLQFVSIQPALGNGSIVRDDSWPSSTEAVKATGATAPGEIGFITYTIKAPAKKGDYVASFKLLADGQQVEGGELTIPITVTADGYIDPTPIPTPGVSIPPSTPGIVPPISGDISSLPNEPIIRVGVYRTTDDTMKVRGITTSMNAVLNGSTVCTFSVGQEAAIVYQRGPGKYVLSGPGCSSESTGYYSLIASDNISPLEVTDYSRPVAWLPGANDNKYRNKLELRYTPSTGSVWVINELPIESYLKGIGETSDVSPLEYQKALLTAARTYAMYHVNRGTKHADEFFHVDAHLDQVYIGYGQEARSPNIVNGVVTTRGQIVTYNGQLAITPYFSRSDGRTRDWTEVWGGKGYPWLKSVDVKWDVGQTLWGHGVGLSARGALYMASKDHATYDQILKHFYTGIELRQIYK